MYYLREETGPKEMLAGPEPGPGPARLFGSKSINTRKIDSRASASSQNYESLDYAQMQS